MNDPPGWGWRRYAACRGLGTELFFAETANASFVAGRKVCFGCPVRQACLDYALEHHIPYGVWGGTSERERRRMTRRRIRDQATTA